MTEPDFNLMLAILKEIRGDIAEMKQDLADLKLRVHVLEDQYASLAMSMAGLNHRLDRVQADVSLIRRRLDLVDAD
jgi:septal ring factor EnvC (AmiA/AmiB activator)